MENQNNPSHPQREAIDRLADAFEAAFQASKPLDIERIVADHPDLRPFLLKELISLEVELRRNVGEQFSVDEYRNRFPQDSLIVDDVFFTTALHDNSTPANDLFTNATLDEHAAPEKMGRYVIRPRSIKS